MNTLPTLDNQIPWTTTRCNRLLRPIASRLAVLRKHTLDRRSLLLKNSNSELDGRTKPIVQAENRVNISQGSKDVRPRGFDKAQDPDWMPKPKQVGIARRMYKGKASKLKVVAESTPGCGTLARPGDVYLPTPYIARSLKKLEDSPHIQPSPLQPTRKAKLKVIKPKEDLQVLKKQMTADMWKQIDGLYDGLSNLLQATKSDTDKSRKGTRSLFSMCLRQVPAYIRLEEHFLEEDGDDNDTDVANEIYSYLEDHGAVEDGIGWKPLREVVKAHAVSLLQEAIEDRILVPGVILGLYRLCMNASAWNEAEQILSSYVLSQGFIDPPKDLHYNIFGMDYSPCWSMINEFVTRTQRYQFLFEQLRLALSHDLLPVEWLATRGMHPVWTRVVRVLSDEHHHTYASAFGLLESAVIAGLGMNDAYFLNADGLASSDDQYYGSGASPKADIRDALSNTFSSLFTLLSSIASVSHQRSEGIDKDTVRSIAWALLGITTSIVDRVNIGTEHYSEIDAIYTQRALYAMAAPFLLLIEGITLGSASIDINMDKHITVLDRLSTAISRSDSNAETDIETLPQLVCSSARCFGRASQDDGFDHLRRLVRCLADPHRQISTQSQWFMKRVALAASMKFAVDTRKSAHAAFSNEIERTVQNTGPLLLEQTPARKLLSSSPTVRKGFRWEEGICEWVACTPFARPQIQQVIRPAMQSSTFPPTPTDSESEPDTPLSNGSINAIDTTPLSAAPTLPSRMSPSVTPSHAYSPKISLISDIEAKGDGPPSPSKKRNYSPDLPVSKRRRTASSDRIEPIATESSSPDSYPRTNRLDLGSRRTSDHSLNRKRRSLGEIADIVTKLKTGKLLAKLTNKANRNAERLHHSRELSSDQDDGRSNSYVRAGCLKSADKRAKTPSRPASNITPFERPLRTSTGDVGTFETEDSEEDELSFTETRISNAGHGVKKAVLRRGLRCTVSARSAMKKREFRTGRGACWSDSEDELNFR
ncbi:uncharacterized protein BDZ99DRAFT_5415 [Mytilinidion resinicola]|uniref:Uncharacterized protein n=1 Tax=Mytilinidion resinicola TaxID=574789 RepID=A0A6A6Z831_9PEZI|nr:uncharacterized protein BDZ99DRAFT_5415 [Mytilinidion resinicola]KAF2816958.1 hypothetical protein BDZ99DRAFT_5415 [Mytilinidion resinicola]